MKPGICSHCGKTFQKDYPNRRLCSVKCQLLSNTEVNEDTGCREWKGSAYSEGYGKIKVGGKTNRAHKISYEQYVGPVPRGLLVCHTCDNPSCVNPEHLFLGTHQDNRADMLRKGRQSCPRGEKHGNSKLTASLVRQIRSLYEDRCHTQKEIATAFGIHQTTVSELILRKKWRHLK